MASNAVINEFPTVDDYSSESEDEDDFTLRPCISHEAMMKLYLMRVNDKLCDGELRLEDSKSYKIHRAILSTCSTYFSALFTTPLHENESTFDIIGVPSKAIEWIIMFAYLRETSFIDKSNVNEVFAMADFFGVEKLMKVCIDFMCKNFTPENCVGLWLMARFRFIPRLMEKSWNYILEKFNIIAVNSEDILQLNIDDFFSIINDDLLNVKDEVVVWEALLRWIDFDLDSRLSHLAKLMRGVRMGLLSNEYFMEKVKTHAYVENNHDVKEIVVETLKFLCDLEELPGSNAVVEVTTTKLAIPRLPRDIMFAIGGWSEGVPQSCIETYDTRADRWIRLPPNFEEPFGPRSYHGTAVIGTKIYVIGGFDGSRHFNTCNQYDVVKKRWKEIAPMHIKRCYVSVTILDGKIYALGGYNGNSRQNTVERYCPKKNQWKMLAPMNVKRSDADACTLNGKIYITGGFTGQECTNTAEFYDPITNTWTLLPHMLSRRSGVSCVAYESCIYVFGGFNGLTRLKTAEKYDLKRKRWTPIEEMKTTRSNFGIGIINDTIMVIGGFNGTMTVSNCECYVPEINEWYDAADMSMIRSALTASVVSGLPNVSDYVPENRDKLIEEKRRRILGYNSSISSFNFDATNENSVSIISIQLDFPPYQIEDSDNEADDEDEEREDDENF